MTNSARKIFREKGLRGVYVYAATKAFDKADKEDWKSALFASRIVGKYKKGATLGLSDDTGVSVDTIENRAHAYELFEKLCNIENGTFRKFVFIARRAPYIYISHFLALYKLQGDYNLSDGQVLDLLMDIVQGEGTLSSRKLENHITGKYGCVRNWDYYTQQAMKDMSKALGHPELPKRIRKEIEKFYDFLGKNS